MKTRSLPFLLALLCTASIALKAADSKKASKMEKQTLYFAEDTAEDDTHLILTIDGKSVTGTQSWHPKKEAHGAQGTIKGTINSEGLIKVVYEYTIEGSEQSQDEVYKLKGDNLFIGDGELKETKGTHMTFRYPDKLTFEQVLKQVPVSQPKIGTPERKEIMDAMRKPVASHVGKEVIFTGEVLTSGVWASFKGAVATKDGKAPKDETVAAEMELDFYALLKRVDDQWIVQHWAFSGDISAAMDAKEKCPEAPWVMFE